VDQSTANTPSREDIRDWDNENFLHPWDSVDNSTVERVVASTGEGIYLVDQEGKQYIDGPGGMWCVQIGYGRQEMADAIAAQSMQLPYFSPFSMASEPSSVLANKLASLTPGDLNTVCFTTGGSSAVDTAIRFVQFYNNLRDKREKKLIISREKAYHGSTYLAASLSGKERDKRLLDTEERLVRFLPDVNPYKRSEGVSVEDWCDEKVADLDNMIENCGADKVAAFIAEPLLASGGVVVPPKGYHKRCLDVCRKHDVLYISDEVVTGFGRLGHWFASEEVFDIVPDIITCAKGLTSGYLPLGAALISDRLMGDLPEEQRDGAVFSSGFTYSGHPVCCAAALKNIEIIESEGILEHVREVVPHFQQRLNALARFEIVGDIRGEGLMGCIEGSAGANSPVEDKLKIDHEFGARIDQRCEELGLLVRPLINMCVFSPPLIITKEQIDQMFDILEQALTDVQSEML